MSKAFLSFFLVLEGGCTGPAFDGNTNGGGGGATSAANGIVASFPVISIALFLVFTI